MNLCVKHWTIFSQGILRLNLNAWSKGCAELCSDFLPHITCLDVSWIYSVHYSSCTTTLYRNKVSRDDAGIWDVSVRVRFEECDRLRGDDHFTFTICYLKCYNILQYPYDIDRVSCWHITTYIYCIIPIPNRNI